MATNFKTRFWRLTRWFILLFIALFVFRIIYGYVATDTNSGNDASESFFNSIDNVRKNYASEKISLNNSIRFQADQTINQKFEKTAAIRTTSAEFEKDEKRIKEKTKSYNAIIQYEQNLGKTGNRQIHLLIGVNPGLFDSFYVDIQKIGLVQAIQITKVDKTNEYMQLNAKRTSIEKTLQSLQELKSKGGQISDFVSLNDKILEVEEKLQELGVELGNFDAEHEFCTVKFSLYEGATEKNISLIYRSKIALEWTIKYFAFIVFTALGLSITVFLLLLIVDKLKLLTTVQNKLNE